ncbi:FAD-dependent oxidoreductase [Actinophytocola xanthii]|uniref:Pentachlorophenol monooxygenase n=1 Tax=Actinophytocola xanthii TaxID=1912961 RepID=A0A1Q8CDS2_9PSEU|nr:NAD(P)/FAD-dependent oxidoreductase [Actinophytocola xanthii]OLF12517.1 pentachlorophenol monooxygenase [Actinophytocola xanthii]
MTVDVLVVGAGPVGLTAAAYLAAHGVAVTVVDKQAEGHNTSRAAVIHARTLEALDEIGVTERLGALAIASTRFSIRDRDRVLVPVRFDELPSTHRHMLLIPQSVTERVLAERVEELGATVLRPRTLVGLQQRDDAVVATFGDGEPIQARYVLGADGTHSTVRDLVGIDFGSGDGGETFVLADVRVDGGLPPDQVVLFFSTSGLLVSAPLPDGSFRIVSQVDDPPALPTAEYVQDLLRTRGPASVQVAVEEVVWGSRFRVRHQVAATFRRGRVLLAGDAAHVHSPAGGQGMNLGLRDAVALARELVAVLGGAAETRLDHYADTQRAKAVEVVAFAARLTRLATTGRALRPVRNLALRGLATLPVFRRRLANRLAGLSDR